MRSRNPHTSFQPLLLLVQTGVSVEAERAGSEGPSDIGQFGREEGRVLMYKDVPK